MASSILKKGKQGYGYNYTELAEINKYLADMGLSYYQYIEPVGESDYIYTVKVDEEGKESQPIRGCKVITGAMVDKHGKPTANVVQDYGAALTYARRYSLMMAYGLSTTDSDGLTRDEIKAKEEKKQQKTKPKPQPKPVPKPASSPERQAMEEEILFLAKIIGWGPDEICKIGKVKSLDELSDERLSKCLDYIGEMIAEKEAAETAEE